MVDPEIKTLEAYERRGEHWLLLKTFENDDAVSLAPFDAVAFDLAALWAD